MNKEIAHRILENETKNGSILTNEGKLVVAEARGYLEGLYDKQKKSQTGQKFQGDWFISEPDGPISPWIVHQGGGNRPNKIHIYSEELAKYVHFCLSRKLSIPKESQPSPTKVG